MKTSQNNELVANRRTVLAGMGAAAAAAAIGVPALAADHVYDAVVVGTGVAGISAALRLQQAGLDVLVIEKRAVSGGNSSVSQGGFLIPPTDNQAGADLMCQDIIDKSQGRAEEPLARMVANNAYRCYHWIEDNGFATWYSNGVYLPFHSHSCASNEGIYTFLGTMVETFEANGGKVLYSTKLRDLLVDENDAVCGVKVKGVNGVERLYAKRVILASGGYSANKGMLEQYAGANADDIATRGFHTNTGDGLLAAVRLGAGLIQVGGYESMHVAGVHPESVSHGDPGSATGVSIAVNANGKRFVDESLGYVAHGKALISQPGATSALVYDQAIADAEIAQGMIGWALMQWGGAGLELFEAQSLEELAGKINVDPAALVATVEKYNAAVDETTMSTAGLEINKSTLAFKIENPPFYAFYPLVPGCCITLGGLKIDDTCRVLEPDGEPIENLYAAGEVTGGLFYDDYVGGTALMSALVMGIVSAESVIAELA